jgi:ElaB/YqjD/DUF883 family membrane-anchored ribosome-binding protein
MSNKIDETILRARGISEKVGESIHEQTDELSKTILERQKQVDDFVHEEPYMAMGISFLAGLGLGVVLFGLTRRSRD